MGRSSMVVVVLLTLACRKPAPAAPEPPDPDAATAVVQLGAYRDQACACTDDACTRQVAGERATWLAAEHGRYRFTEEQRAAADTANRAYDACNTRPHAREAARALDDLRGLSDEMCACTDKACAEGVTAEMMKLGERYEDTKATEQEMRIAADITEKLTRCMAKAMGMGAGTTP